MHHHAQGLRLGRGHHQGVELRRGGERHQGSEGKPLFVKLVSKNWTLLRKLRLFNHLDLHLKTGLILGVLGFWGFFY